MFEQSFISTAKTRKSWTVVVAFAGQILVIGALLAIPLLYVQSLPVAQMTSVLLAPPPTPPPPPPPPPPAATHVARATHTAPRMFDVRRLIAPTTIPKQVASIKDIPELAPPSVQPGVIGGVSGGVAGGVLGGVLGGVPSAAPPPPPPPPKAEAPKPTTPSRIRIGGQVEAAKLVHEVQPQYPELAKETRTGGLVRLKAIIGTNGRVEDLSLLSGQPLLVPAAMNAVKQWEYRPTYLNGRPVEVLTEVDVNFQLSS